MDYIAGLAELVGGDDGGREVCAEEFQYDGIFASWRFAAWCPTEVLLAAAFVGFVGVTSPPGGRFQAVVEFLLGVLAELVGFPFRSALRSVRWGRLEFCLHLMFCGVLVGVLAYFFLEGFFDHFFDDGF